MAPLATSLKEKLRTVPMLRALVPMVAGIALAALATLPLYVWAVAAAVCALAAVGARGSGWLVGLYAALAIVFFGGGLARFHMPVEVVPRGERVWMEMRLDQEPVHRSGRRSASSYGTVVRWRGERGEWLPAGERLLVSIDTTWSFTTGDRVVFRGYVNPVTDNATADTAPDTPAADTSETQIDRTAGSADSFGRLMRARGYTGRTYISQYSRPELVPGAAKSPAMWARRLQTTATERLLRLGRNADTGTTTDTTAGTNALSVAAAMTTGHRASIEPSLNESYSRTGAMHVLSVSGLHVGIVFGLINALLYLLPLFRRGHIVKNVVAIVAIWFYAALTGLSPSAVRAAFMFSGAQIALATSQSRNPANVMCACGVAMLAVRPGLLLDISFQLSFISVAAIMAWFGPLYRLVESRWRLLSALWATLVIGVVASVATLPLVSHTFGLFSLAGVVLNPLVAITSCLTICFSLVWIALPLPLLEPLFRWLVVGPVWIQNRAVELTASVPGAAVEWTMPLWAVFVVYAVMTIFTLWLVGRPRRDEPFTLER